MHTLVHTLVHNLMHNLVHTLLHNHTLKHTLVHMFTHTLSCTTCTQSYTLWCTQLTGELLGLAGELEAAAAAGATVESAELEGRAAVAQGVGG